MSDDNPTVMSLHNNVEQVLNQTERSLVGVAMGKNPEVAAEARKLIPEVQAAKRGLEAGAAATTIRKVTQQVERPQGLTSSESVSSKNTV